jgi:hypothetical protein
MILRTFLIKRGNVKYVMVEHEHLVKMLLWKLTVKGNRSENVNKYLTIMRSKLILWDQVSVHCVELE